MLHKPTKLNLHGITLDNLLDLDINDLVKLTQDTHKLTQVLDASNIPSTDWHEYTQIIRQEIRTLNRNRRRELIARRKNAISGATFNDLMLGIYETPKLLDASETTHIIHAELIA